MLLLDANVVSELRKVRLGKADAYVAHWANRLDTDDLYLSVITVQELEIGVLLAERRDPTQGAVLRTWLNLQVPPAFIDRILPVDTHCTAQRPTARAQPPACPRWIYRCNGAGTWHDGGDAECGGFCGDRGSARQSVDMDPTEVDPEFGTGV